ncbi:MAG: SHOCT domain-containing protein [Anaerolineaceae bacterium]|nr:SHOCT domain-containing protein [Anaerolineaceae bacterium]
MMMCHWYGGLGWIGMVINLILSVSLIIGVVFLVIWIVKRLSNNDAARIFNNAAPSAVEIAKVRYVKGEITREEFQKLVTDLGTR